ncbi:MAG: hypothetical protein PHU12_01635 [Candidatus Aenigmarchaeota archaeon]|nr:hypothetical protein [Candidatus Aenigmarchaeota archaeon]
MAEDKINEKFGKIKKQFESGRMKPEIYAIALDGMFEAGLSEERYAQEIIGLSKKGYINAEEKFKEENIDPSKYLPKNNEMTNLEKLEELVNEKPTPPSGETVEDLLNTLAEEDSKPKQPEHSMIDIIYQKYQSGDFDRFVDEGTMNAETFNSKLKQLLDHQKITPEEYQSHLRTEKIVAPEEIVIAQKTDNRLYDKEHSIYWNDVEEKLEKHLKIDQPADDENNYTCTTCAINKVNTAVGENQDICHVCNDNLVSEDGEELPKEISLEDETTNEETLKNNDNFKKEALGVLTDIEVDPTVLDMIKFYATTNGYTVEEADCIANYISGMSEDLIMSRRIEGKFTPEMLDEAIKLTDKEYSVKRKSSSDLLLEAADLTKKYDEEIKQKEEDIAKKESELLEKEIHLIKATEAQELTESEISEGIRNLKAERERLEKEKNETEKRAAKMQKYLAGVLSPKFKELQYMSERNVETTYDGIRSETEKMFTQYEKAQKRFLDFFDELNDMTDDKGFIMSEFGQSLQDWMESEYFPREDLDAPVGLFVDKIKTTVELNNFLEKLRGEKQ